MTESTKIGYARVSTEDQNLDRQLEELNKLKLRKIFTDKSSGKDTNREGFQQMMDYVREGDELYVLSMDRLARSTVDLLTVTQTLKDKGVSVHFLKENVHIVPYGKESAISDLLIAMLGAVAQFERSLIRERQAQGIALAKKRGAYKGRKPTSSAVITKALAMIDEGIPISKVAERLKISRKTIYKYLPANWQYKEKGGVAKVRS